MNDLAAVYMVLVVIVLVLVITWICLPIILLSTNAHLRRVIAAQERTNELLAARLPDLGRR